MLILAIESSCDDTAAAVLEDDRKVLANIISSQFDVHARYGGIVPELASRRHIEAILPVVREALDTAGIDLEQIDCIAATQGPGLIGSLLVGFTFAKALALVKNIPCVGVDHMSGHLLSAFLRKPAPDFPYVSLVVSGGNSSLYRVDDRLSFHCLGRTRDDAAGEAFDKVAKLLELGYPGGPIISRLAKTGRADSISFPRAWLDNDSLDFSFSGLKTAVVNYIHKRRQQNDPLPIADICASFQEAVVDVLVEKTVSAAKNCGISTVVLGGGVASNDRLRDRMRQRCDRENLMFFVPPPVFCTDNAAMIGLAGYYSYLEGHRAAPDADVYSRSPLS
ncbi:MAG: tRNA (adenosine(37)-N6)-threonylcarbamoyltransferase complex transferase subunit TsaD [Desulfobulbaceae bacterium]|nr:tRNA (adenosine(37)-N6)-threonylcarbamoyltransferase complex transferase subunit TsaD [Desulfobulbaceae bacterium]